MSSIEKTLSITCSFEREVALASLVGLDAPGGYAIREADGRIMVWASESDSSDDDGSNAIFRSHGPESDEAWRAVSSLAFVEESEQM